MTVSELIKELSAMPQTLQVGIVEYDSYYEKYHFYELDSAVVEVFDFKKKSEEVVRLSW